MKTLIKPTAEILKNNATTLENIKILYDINDNIKYWYQWAKKFIEACDELGWYVVSGSGNSFNNILVKVAPINTSVVSPSGNNHLANWDCDWNTSDHVAENYQGIPNPDETKIIDLFTNFQWSNEKINENLGIFDVVIYTTNNIGIRIKYPIISEGCGYQFRDGLYNMLPQFYKRPIITVVKAETDINYQPSRTTSGINSIKGAIAIGENTSDNIIQYSVPLEEAEPFDLNFQLNREELNFSSIKSNFNKMHYHFSKGGYTSYMYITNNSSTVVSFKMISAFLEDEEKSIVILETNENIGNSLGEAVLCSDNYVSVENPQYRTWAPFNTVVDTSGNYSLVRFYVPQVGGYCKELYHVNIIGNSNIGLEGTYIQVHTDNVDEFFHVFPFGKGTNIHYLAIPIVMEGLEDE